MTTSALSLHFTCFVHVVPVPYDIHYNNMHTEPSCGIDTFILNDKSISNIDDVTEPMPSTSSIPCQVLSDVRSGLELLESALFGSHSSGLVASLFSDSVKNDSSKLQHLVSLHGIASHGLSND